MTKKEVTPGPVMAESKWGPEYLVCKFHDGFIVRDNADWKAEVTNCTQGLSEAINSGWRNDVEILFEELAKLLGAGLYIDREWRR